jgi:hypothetical protein
MLFYISEQKTLYKHKLNYKYKMWPRLELKGLQSKLYLQGWFDTNYIANGGRMIWLQSYKLVTLANLQRYSSLLPYNKPSDLVYTAKRFNNT